MIPVQIENAINNISFHESKVLKMSTPNLCAGYKKYGISRNIIRYIMLNEFHVNKEYHDCLAEYNLLHWSSSFTLASINEGTIRKNNREYIVVFHRCTRFDITKCKTARISFRAAQPEFNLPAYALIMPMKEEEI